MTGFGGYVAAGGIGEDPSGWIDGAPTTARGQSCAVCATSSVTWVHPLDAELARYRVRGQGYTLPTFWALCDRCETLHRAGDDESLVAVWASSASSVLDLDEDAREPIVVFRRADRGARRLHDAD